jgi:hypothetical protein
MAVPPPVTIGLPTRTWPASPVTYASGRWGLEPRGTRGALGPTPSPEVDIGATGTRGAPGAALRREVGAGATGPCGAPEAALRREVGAGAAETRGAPGAALRREVGAGAVGTRGGLRATLSRELGIINCLVLLLSSFISCQLNHVLMSPWFVP